jgi:hypothetical protein
MAKTWVLDTETKGTGAHIVPLGSRPTHPQAREPELDLTRFRAPARDHVVEELVPKAPRRFKVVDVLGARTLAEDVAAAGAVAALARLRKPVDARVYVREAPAGRWRLLTIGETRALWRFREAADGAPPRE